MTQIGKQLLNGSNLLYYFYIQLRSEKAGRFENMLHFDSSPLFVTHRSRVSRAPPHHTLPAFITLELLTWWISVPPVTNSLR